MKKILLTSLLFLSACNLSPNPHEVYSGEDYAAYVSDQLCLCSTAKSTLEQLESLDDEVADLHIQVLTTRLATCKVETRGLIKKLPEDIQTKYIKKWEDIET